MPTPRLPRRPDLLTRSHTPHYRDCRCLIRLPFPRATRTAATLAEAKPSRFSRYTDPTIYNPTTIPKPHVHPKVLPTLHQVSTVPAHIRPPTVPVTVYGFPSFAPLALHTYPSTHLLLPPRRDLLHRAIVFEGDAERQGTQSTKSRREVYGSGRKLAPQKGRGRARVGDKKSPTRKGGGLAHPPKPRDHASRLNVKMYDRAWRTALSLRYRRGELVVVEGVLRGEGEGELPRTKIAKMAEAFEDAGRKKEEGTTLWVLNREEGRGGEFRRALRTYWPKDRVTVLKDVDVKMLLEGSRVVIEKEALDMILTEHQADLQLPVDVAKAKQVAEEGAAAMNEAVERTKKMQLEELEKARAVRLDEIKRIMDGLSEGKD